MQRIKFSPPDITDEEICEVIDTLKSGWITTGPKVRKFEELIAEYNKQNNAICVNSATAGLELCLRAINIKEGDEIITTPYTFAATSNVILHLNAKPVFVDINYTDFLINPDRIEEKINPKTKAIITVDFAGLPCDYEKIINLARKYNLYLINDAAHSFGALYKNKPVAYYSDFTVFSFHAVKNLTTAEGGAIILNDNLKNKEEIIKYIRLLTLHGQDKSAYDKFQNNKYDYDILLPGYKFNMTDILASIGISQLKRYDTMLDRRKTIITIYNDYFSKKDNFILPIYKDENRESSYHLYPLRIKDLTTEKKEKIINEMYDNGISLNTHFKPLPLMSFYKKLGYKIEDYPVAFKCYNEEISLPLYSTLKPEEAKYIAETLLKIVDRIL